MVFKGLSLWFIGKWKPVAIQLANKQAPSMVYQQLEASSE
jgi:hypothetical protein